MCFFTKRHTAGPWLLRNSGVRFSLVCSFKKQPKYLSNLCDFHYISEGIPSLMRFWLPMTFNCCEFGSCGVLPDLKKCTSQGPGVLLEGELLTFLAKKFILQLV